MCAPLYSAHPRESGDPGVFVFNGHSNGKNLGPRFRGDERWRGMALALSLTLAPTLATAAPLDLADLNLGQTLACASKDPARQLYVVIGRIEPLGGRAAVSVSLYDKQPGSPLPQMAHLPLDLEALAASCTPTTQESLTLSPLFESGYADWRKAVEAHKAGVFSISVDDIDDLVRKQIAGAKPAEAISTQAKPSEPKP